MSEVTVLAAGTWGSALAGVLADGGHSVILWDIDKEKIDTMRATRLNPALPNMLKFDDSIEFSSDLKAAVSGAEYILNTVPTQFVRSVLQNLGDIDKNIVFINAAKGLEIGTQKRISEIVAEFLPEHDYAVLSGPSHAEEVARKMPTTLVAASHKQKIAFAVQDLFITPYMRVYAHQDVTGIELAGALKNVIAIGAGVVAGLGYGDNALAALMTRGIMEIKRLGFALGAMPETFDGLAGIGDLIVTCMSNHSRNRTCGSYLAEGLALDEAIAKVGQSVEGAYTIKAAEILRKENNVEMPITKELYGVLYERESVKRAVVNLMSRTKKHELDESFHKY